MQLKSLKVFGFKTFAEATTLDFSPGITAVVGPNGSGKSNLVDAIRWVLGEQSSRSLRSQKTEDVIFAGNTSRKPLGMAEVTLTFDNDDGALKVDYAQVQITRRAYRAGESEYFINRHHVRLRDVVELLMGTGLGPGSYAIVSQGQIDAILSSKPTERRSLFEETAGIVKFLARKTEALRRLEGTEQNAIRVHDLVAELERRAPELDAQVRRAQRYHRTAARLRDLEILSYVRASTARRDQRERISRELETCDGVKARAAASVAVLGAELAALRSALYTFELDLDAQREAAGAARAALAQCEAQSAAASARRETLVAQSASAALDHDRMEAERLHLRATIEQLTMRLAPLGPGIDELREREATIDAAATQAREGLDAMYTELRATEALVAERVARQAERRAHMTSARAEHERLTIEIERARSDVQRLGAQIENARAAVILREAIVREREATAVEQRELAVAAQTRGTVATVQSGELQTRYRAVAAALSSAQARLHTIEELEATLEGHVPGTRAIVEAAQRGELCGLHGVVSQLIEVDEPYARALDVAFGASLSNLVMATSEDAERAVGYLRERELGRATFLPLDTLAARIGNSLGGLPQRSGVIGYAHTLVRADAAYVGIVAFLVGRILVVDTLATGIGLVRGAGLRDTIVTLEGEQMFGGGAITGGRQRRERSILARRAQAQLLRDQIPALLFELEGIERDASAARGAASTAAIEREQALKAAGEAEIALRDVRTQLQSLGADIERLQTESAAALARRAATESASETCTAKLQALEAVTDEHVELEAERARGEARLAAARAEIGRIEVLQGEIRTELGGLRQEVAALDAQRESAVTRFALLDADAVRSDSARESTLREIELLAERIAIHDAQRDAARRQVAARESDLEVTRRRREMCSDEAAQKEAAERSAQRDEREATAAAAELRRRLAEIDAELGILQTNFAQHLASADEQREVVERFADASDSIADELPRLREELVRLANVNLNAQADRDQLTEREAFLRAQLDDLARARETLLATIVEIETACQAVFNETFEAVRVEFEEMFARLFPGGKAKMWQTEPDKLSETGVEIAVAPPGKKMTALPALSGGERAMTAAALIFALIRVKPSPFYLLDEVDAALDDANVDRLSAMIREVASAAQILVVTHNKKTMELAAQMYGVTMAEPGVSSIISASLDPQPTVEHPQIDDVREPVLAL